MTPPGKELDRAIDLANKIAAAAPLGVRATLSSSRQALAADEATALAALQAEVMAKDAQLGQALVEVDLLGAQLRRAHQSWLWRLASRFG